MSTTTATTDRALFDRLPRLGDLVPFVPLADGLPTPVDRVEDRFWVQRDDLSDSRYGGNKVRKLEHLLAIAARRGGPVLTAGAIGSHHVVATAVHAQRLGLEVEAVRFPQPRTDHVDAMFAKAAGARRPQRRRADAPRRCRSCSHDAGPASRRPGRRSSPQAGRPPSGSSATWARASSWRPASPHEGWDEPDDVVVALGSGGSSVGLSLGLALAGWRRATVVAVRVADRIVTNAPVLRGIEAGVRSLLALGGGFPPPARWTIDGRWFGPGYGHPTEAGSAAAERAVGLGLRSEPTYTAKALAAAFERLDDGRRVVFLQTLSA